ncbi:MAG: GTP 3',8-cyclase MoaA [Proteobacteria bacterium]|nr:GTP 3',8-cyclase MoaA [Pseudomonadota bacterium]
MEKNPGKCLIDGCGRTIRYLRVSVTDRCNLQCRYCCPSIRFRSLPHENVISYEEIARLAGILAQRGVSSVRITGGEPLVRKHIERLVHFLTRIPGIREVSLTTNGLLLEDQAEILAKAGLARVNVSLDSFLPERFNWITRSTPANGQDGPTTVLRGIQAARKTGLVPIKINVVLMRGVNDDEILSFTDLTRDLDDEVRFIEFMPLCPEISWGNELMLPSSEIMERIEKSRGPLIPVERGAGSGPAVRYRIPGHAGTVGFISAMSDHFCAGCNRIRLTSDGKLLTCLFSEAETDLLTPMRSGAGDNEILSLIEEAVRQKASWHGIAQNQVCPSCSRCMFSIGG